MIAGVLHCVLYLRVLDRFLVYVYGLCMRRCKTAATIATTLERNVMSNAGATIPVMSSLVPRARNMSVAIPATIKPLIVIAAYFIYFNVVASCRIENLLIVVALIQKKGAYPLVPFLSFF